MPRYDLYRSVHKFIRREMFRFGKKLGMTDFRNKKAVTVTKESFDDLAFDLKMHALKEEKWFTPLFAAKESDVSKITAADHANQESVLETFKGLFNTALDSENVEVQLTQGNQIRSDYDKFLAHNLEHFHQEERTFSSRRNSINA